jgi:pantoate--beta-alanine ligase
VRSIPAIGRWSDDARADGERIGFVPTMGNLHAGHAALMRAARSRCDRVVVSVFVNPTQFGEGEDYGAYPRTLAADRKLARIEEVDVIFAPSTDAMYPEPAETRVTVPRLTVGMCGEGRPGHFDGVCLVVTKLLNMIRPHEMYMGKKDFQQLVVLKRMVADLNIPVRVRSVPTVREPDGLAMSSRNAYLTRDQRAYAPRIQEALRLVKRRARAGELRAAVLRRWVMRHLEGREGKVEYVAFVDAKTLDPLTTLGGNVLVAVAVRVGRARLIDNIDFKIS